MRQRCCKRKPRQHLRHPRLLGLPRDRGLAHPPVASSHAVLDAFCDILLLHRLREIDLPPLVHRLLHCLFELLDQSLEAPLEESSEEGPRQVDALVGIVIPFIGKAPTERASKQPVADVAKEVLLLGQSFLSDANVRQQLPDEHVLSVPDTVLPRSRLPEGSPANVVQGSLSRAQVLTLRSLVEGGPESLHHLDVFEVVDNVLQDLPVALNTHGPEHNHNGDLLANVWKGDAHRGPELCVVLSVPKLHEKGRRGLVAFLDLAAALCHVGKLAEGLFEAKHEVVGTPLLRQNNLLRSIDDEIPALILRALLELHNLLVCLVVQPAHLRPEHHRNLAQGHPLVRDLVYKALPPILEDLELLDIDVDKEVARVRELPKTRHVGEQAVLLSIALHNVGLRNPHLAKLNLILDSSHVHLIGHVLLRRRDLDLSLVVLNDLLNVLEDELIV
mmetsp:Transcript_6028/g.14517  ORF Transcript_6028/g.14517 Transcript_6028/m.14517 type:complete len:445 (-) Transcript_6028:172-1506(-)